MKPASNLPARANFDSQRWPSSCAQMAAISLSGQMSTRRFVNNKSPEYGRASAWAAELLSIQTPRTGTFILAETAATICDNRSGGGWSSPIFLQDQTNPPSNQKANAPI